MKEFLAIILCISSAAVFADSLSEPRTVKRVFSEGIASAGFMSTEGFSQCLYGIMYLDLGKDSGKAQFSMLLSAKASGQKIVRIDYSVDGIGKCNLSGLHIE